MSEQPLVPTDDEPTDEPIKGVIVTGLTVPEAMALSPTKAAELLRKSSRIYPGSFTAKQLAHIIKRYREGASSYEISDELKERNKTVREWLQRAEQLHLLRIRRQGEVFEEKQLTKRLDREEERQRKQEEDEDKDLALAERLRERIESILDAITPAKISAAKLKDLTSSMSMFIEKYRLLTNKSTANTASQNIVHYITQLNTLSVADKVKMIAGRNAPALPEPSTDELIPMPRPDADPDDDDTEDVEPVPVKPVKPAKPLKAPPPAPPPPPPAPPPPPPPPPPAPPKAHVSTPAPGVIRILSPDLVRDQEIAAKAEAEADKSADEGEGIVQGLFAGKRNRRFPGAVPAEPPTEPGEGENK